MHLLVLLLTLRLQQCYSTPSWILPNLFWSPQVLIVPSMYCFRLHINTDKHHLLLYWAQSQLQHSTLPHTWAFSGTRLVSGSNCVHPVYSWQKWRLYLSHSPSQNPQESGCKFPILPLSSQRQSLPLTVSHPHFWPPIHFVLCAPSVCVLARNKNQQKLDDKVDTCELFLVRMSYAFLQCESWDQPANVLRSWDI